MQDYLLFMKDLFFCMLYFTGIIACFFFMISFLRNIFVENKKSKPSKVININGDELISPATKKELDKLAEKIAEEVLSDEYKKED